ncbi:unnamed protein product [Paramecium octaurelia]|uniref:Uncharacterized protein n=1 Tax=Paramecium octaurelia TaxID=43137 RepID=A0A8S1X7D0_PAROT|nr:unnamed protein product [Paramecium octaurelia]
MNNMLQMSILISMMIHKHNCFGINYIIKHRYLLAIKYHDNVRLNHKKVLLNYHRCNCLQITNSFFYTNPIQIIGILTYLSSRTDKFFN